MKTFKKLIFAFVCTLFVAVIAGTSFSAVLNVEPIYGISALVGLSFIPMMPSGALGMGILRELWTGELIAKFRLDKTWLSRVPNRSDLVQNNVIHLVDIGADPNVLINNTTYPVPVVTREDIDVPIGLDKFDTENTSIPDDELQGLPYDKNGSVLQQHRLTLEEATAMKSAHSLAPSVHSVSTPIILTKGDSNGETIARKMCTPASIIAAKKALDKKKVPLKDRILVLCPEHIADLLAVDEKFALQYKNIRTGEVLPMYGFDIYEFGGNPKYHDVAGTLTKKAYGAADDDVNDQVASFFFSAIRTNQFLGDVIMYNSVASVDPINRRSLIGFKMYHMCLPVKQEGFGVIVSDKV
jgi:hypothetical protein